MVGGAVSVRKTPYLPQEQDCQTITGQGAWNPGCEFNLAVHNPHPQETPFQDTAEAESKATSVLRQVMSGRHCLLCIQVLTGPEKLRVPEMGHASLVNWGRILSNLHTSKTTSPERHLR